MLLYHSTCHTPSPSSTCHPSPTRSRLCSTQAGSVLHFYFLCPSKAGQGWDSLRVWRMNEQNEILKPMVTWVIYTYVLRQPLKIFYSWPQEEIYFILWLSTFIYMMERSNELIPHGKHSNILFYSILFYSTPFHSIPILAWVFQEADPETKIQMQVVYFGDDPGNTRKEEKWDRESKAANESVECVPQLRLMMPKWWGNQCIQCTYIQTPSVTGWGLWRQGARNGDTNFLRLLTL